MEREIIVCGIVMNEVIRKEKQSSYKINTGEEELEVVSEGRQAIKDNIFIRKGLQMIVEGEKSGNKVLAKKSKIALKNRSEINEK
jgi:hypothetical protein